MLNGITSSLFNFNKDCLDKAVFVCIVYRKPTSHFCKIMSYKWVRCIHSAHHSMSDNNILFTYINSLMSTPRVGQRKILQYNTLDARQPTLIVHQRNRYNELQETSE